MKLNRERERLEKHNVFETFIEMFFRDRSPFCTTHVTIQLHKRKKTGSLCMSLSFCFRILQTPRLINAPSFCHSFQLFLILLPFLEIY